MRKRLTVFYILLPIAVFIYFTGWQKYVPTGRKASNIPLERKPTNHPPGRKPTNIPPERKPTNIPPERKPTYIPPGWKSDEVVKYRMSWKGHCSFPYYLPPTFYSLPWFPLYLSYLQKVDLSMSSKNRQKVNCARFWYSTPQFTYDELPYRAKGWKPKPKPKPGYVRPKCTFGQKLVPRTRCASAHEVLWRTFDKMGLLYFPRGGTELGILRDGKYLTSDGDLDIFVDMPQKQLLKKLLKSRALSPPPRLSKSRLGETRDEVHWKVKGCPTVHIVFNDWMADEMVKDFGRPTHNDTCTCMINSVPLTCHRETSLRLDISYGPSWRVPLHAKGLDVPQRAYAYNIVGKLNRMASKDGIIYKEAVRALGRDVKYTTEEMYLILAQLNVLKGLLAYQKKTKIKDWV